MSKTVVKKKITHDDYTNTLTKNTYLERDNISIRSFNHSLFTLKQKKNALSSYNDKMKMLDKINCVPFGYGD